VGAIPYVARCDVFRVRLILALAGGASYSQIMRSLRLPLPPSRARSNASKSKGWRDSITVTEAVSRAGGQRGSAV
jgi:hypothetical protein